MPRIPDEEQDSGTRALIEDLLKKPFSSDREELLRRARKRRYHSFDKHAYDLPEIMLIKHLNGAGYKDLAENVTQGKYDQDAEESRKWAEETEEGRAMMQMVRDTPGMAEQLDRTFEVLGKAQKEGRLKVPTAEEIGEERPWKKS